MRKINENFFVPLSLFHHHWTTIIFDFQNVVTAFSSEFLFFNVFFNFQFLFIFYFEYLLLANTILHLTYYYCFSTINRFLIFHYVGEFLFFSKNLAVFTLMNQHMQILSSRVPPNECSPKVVKQIYLWANSFLQTLNSFAKVYESKNSLLGGSQKFISSDFYMKSKILSMKPKSLKLWTHTKQRINLAIRKSK